MTARIEDYTGMEPTPPPEWYYTFSNIQNDWNYDENYQTVWITNQINPIDIFNRIRT